MKDTTIAVGLAKNVFEIAISREAGKVSKQLRVSRPKLVSFFAKQSAATVLLEACGSAHFWARTLRRLGHDVVLLPPHLVRPYRRGSKNDRADTKALLEAYRNEEILSVPIKSVRQHTLAALHRLRSGWLSTRTARINAVRGILRELGLFIPKGAHFVVPAISELVEDADSDLPDVLRPHLRDALVHNFAISVHNCPVLADTRFPMSISIVGSAMRARGLAAQRVEARIGCKILNTMTALGMPDSEMIG